MHRSIDEAEPPSGQGSPRNLPRTFPEPSPNLPSAFPEPSPNLPWTFQDHGSPLRVVGAGYLVEGGGGGGRSHYERSY